MRRDRQQEFCSCICDQVIPILLHECFTYRNSAAGGVLRSQDAAGSFVIPAATALWTWDRLGFLRGTVAGATEPAVLGCPHSYEQGMTSFS